MLYRLAMAFASSTSLISWKIFGPVAMALLKMKKNVIVAVFKNVVNVILAAIPLRANLELKPNAQLDLAAPIAR